MTDNDGDNDNDNGDDANDAARDDDNDDDNDDDHDDFDDGDDVDDNDDDNGDKDDDNDDNDDDTYDEDYHDDNDDANDDDSACSDEAATGRPAKGFLRTDPFPSNFPRLTNLKQRAPNFKTLGPTGNFGLSADTAFVARQHKLSFRWSFLGAGALIKGSWSPWAPFLAPQPGLNLIFLGRIPSEKGRGVARGQYPRDSKIP